MINIFVAVSILIIQCLMIGMFYKYHKTVAHPTVFIQTYFTVHIILALLAFKEHNFSFYGILWILLAMFLFALGGLLATAMPKRKGKSMKINDNNLFKTKLAKKVLVISIIFGCLYSVEFFLRKGLSIRTLFKLEALLSLNHQVAVERYTGTSGGVSIVSRILLTFVYFSPLMAGYNFNFCKNFKFKKMCLFSLMPALLVVLTNNTKATLIAAVFLFASGHITSSIKLNKSLPKLSFKRLLSMLIGLLSFLMMLYASMMMRVGSFDINIINTINRKFILYALGHIPAFDIWFTENANSIDYHFGTRTFYGIADFLGISERAQGIYTDRVYWSTWSTNVYTMFRSFIEDFGPYLGLVIMLFFGFFMSLVFSRVKNSKSISRGTVLLSAFYFYILYGFITSVWSYMSYTLAYVLFTIYVKLMSKKSYNRSSLDKGLSGCINKNMI